jgi:hypothetical protein
MSTRYAVELDDELAKRLEETARNSKLSATELITECVVDKAGRRYRAKIAARVTTTEGVPLFKWADIDDAPREHVEKGVAQKRKAIVADGYHLRIDVDHYNAEHPDEESLQLVLDITDDVEELLIAHGIGDDKAA